MLVLEQQHNMHPAPEPQDPPPSTCQLKRHTACTRETTAAVCEQLSATVTPAMLSNSPHHNSQPPGSCPRPNRPMTCSSSPLPAHGLTYKVQPPTPLPPKKYFVPRRWLAHNAQAIQITPCNAQQGAEGLRMHGDSCCAWWRARGVMIYPKQQWRLP